MYQRRRRKSEDAVTSTDAVAVSTQKGDFDGRNPEPISKVKTVTRKGRKRRNGIIFGLGGLFGLVVAALFANHTDVISLESLMDLNLDSLRDVIPAGIIRDAKELTVCSCAFLPLHKADGRAGL